VTITDYPQLCQGPCVTVSGLITTTRSGSKPGPEFHFVCGRVRLAPVRLRNLTLGWGTSSLDRLHKSYFINLERPRHAFSNYASVPLTQGKSWVSVRLMWVISQRINSLSTRTTR
jgi:hypothetical protein